MQFISDISRLNTSIPPTSHQSRHSILVPVVAAPVAAVVLLLFLGFLLFRRRRSQKVEPPLDLCDGFDDLDVTVEPFPAPGSLSPNRRWDGAHATSVWGVRSDNSAVASSSSLGPYPIPSDWSSSRAEDAAFGSVAADSWSPTFRSASEKKGRSSATTSTAPVSSSQDVQAMRRELDELWQVVGQSHLPPPNYVKESLP
jgi:hypothetical protein